MRVYDLIMKKRDGEILTQAEIEYLISGYTDGTIPDYQMAAFCMAVYFKGMNNLETTALTMAMADSGLRYNLENVKGIAIDKHSTGGVGDTTTLVVAPLVASCGVPVAKMSGRGLGHTGGTIDKLESVPKFNSQVAQTEFIQQVNEINLAIISQSSTIAPADQKLYALRDVTATVDSIPLIASSIMSKKIASGAAGFVLDVKVGVGAFMKSLDQAVILGKTMVNIGKSVNKPTVALLTNMNQPLGNMVGNALEVQEAIQTLAGEGPDDLTELSLRLGAEMLVLSGYSSNPESTYDLLRKKLKTKAGLKKLEEMIEYQGGDVRVITEPDLLLPQAKYKTPVKSDVTGYVDSINSLAIGNFTMELGAGRKTKTDKIDLSVGVELKKKQGDFITAGETLVVVHSNQPFTQNSSNQVKACYHFTENIPNSSKLILEKISSCDV